MTTFLYCWVSTPLISLRNHEMETRILVLKICCDELHIKARSLKTVHQDQNVIILFRNLMSDGFKVLKREFNLTIMMLETLEFKLLVWIVELWNILQPFILWVTVQLIMISPMVFFDFLFINFGEFFKISMPGLFLHQVQELFPSNKNFLRNSVCICF